MLCARCGQIAHLGSVDADVLHIKAKSLIRSEITSMADTASHCNVIAGKCMKCSPDHMCLSCRFEQCTCSDTATSSSSMLGEALIPWHALSSTPRGRIFARTAISLLFNHHFLMPPKLLSSGGL